MSSEILSRITKKLNSPNLIETLAEVASASDLSSVLLETFSRRSSQISPSRLLQQYRNDRFVRPSGISLADSTEFDATAFRLLPPGFVTIELSPLCPLGTCSVLGPVHQNNVVTTIRNSEVCSDVTNVLALEAAARRIESKEHTVQAIKLCTSHRLVRAQLFEGPASFAHFRVLALCTAGRTAGNMRLESEALVEHVGYYVRLLRELSRANYSFRRIRLSLLPLSEQSRVVADAVISRIDTASEPIFDVGVSAVPETPGGYYADMRFQMFLTDDSGTELNIVDGGFTHWTQTLLNNRKEFMLTSGMGTERLIQCFRCDTSGGAR